MHPRDRGECRWDDSPFGRVSLSSLLCDRDPERRFYSISCDSLERCLALGFSFLGLAVGTEFFMAQYNLGIGKQREDIIWKWRAIPLGNV